LTSFRPHYGPRVDSASNRKEYQECFLGVKAAGAWGWQRYHLHVPIVLKSGSLILLEPPGPVQACNGIALPLPLPLPLLPVINVVRCSCKDRVFSSLDQIWISWTDFLGARISLKFDVGNFNEICHEYPYLVGIGQKYLALYTKT